MSKVAPMRITFVIPPPNMSGGIRVIAIYANFLRAQGHEVYVFAPASPRLRWKGLKAKFWTGYGKPPALPMNDFDDMSTALKVVDHSGPLIDDDVPEADIVIATWWKTASWVKDFNPSKGTKVYFVQDYGAAGQEMERIVPTWQMPMAKITISNWLAKTMQEVLPDTDIPVVLNAVNHQQFNRPIRGKQNRPTVGFVYRAQSSKGMDIAKLALEKVRLTFPNLQVIAFGQRDLPPSGVLPEGTLYHPLPKDNELADIYGVCDLWLYPSRLEGFGLPILEAMACRCPVVATRAGAAPDIIKDAENGYLTEIDDISALSARMIEILSMSDSKWRKMSDAAYRVTTGYSWDDAGKLFERALFSAKEQSQARKGS